VTVMIIDECPKCADNQSEFDLFFRGGFVGTPVSCAAITHAHPPTPQSTSTRPRSPSFWARSRASP
jgi:hypothetical protein